MENRVLAYLAFAAACVTVAGCNSGKSIENHAPGLGTTTLNATEDTVLKAQLYGIDVENQGITFARTADAQHGTVVVDAAGGVTYTPNPNYNGADSFGVSLTDSAGASSTGTVAITVAAVNDAPTFPASNTLQTNEDVAAQMQLQATDLDGDALTYSLVNDVQHGSVTVTAQGAVTYTPSPNYFGTDSFTARVDDGAGGQATATVAVTVAAVNDPPVLTTRQVSLAEDTALSTQLAATDVENQTVHFALGTDGAHGHATISDSGALTYQPVADFNGTDSLTVSLTDDNVTHTSFPLTVTVTPVNDPPHANDDDLRLPASASVIVPVLDNDTDVDGDALKVTILTQPGGGTLSVNAQNQVVFTPAGNFNGPIRFNYRVTDAGGVTSDATVRAVIGTFPGLYYLSDETTVGQPEVHWFDGLRVYRISGDMEPGFRITSFSASQDGKKVAFVAQSSTTNRIYLTEPNAQSIPLIYSSTIGSGYNYISVELNRDGSYARVYDGTATPAGSVYIVNTTTHAVTRVGAHDPTLVRSGNYFVFSPTDDTFYAQMQVGGQPPPMSGTGYLTLFRGNSATAADVQRVGEVYPDPSNGGGSGILPQITADGRYVLHEESVFSPNHNSLLSYDSVSNVEAPMYRRPVGSSEIGMWSDFAVSNNGKRVCFRFLEPNSGGSSGPSRFIVGDPGAPAGAAPVTPVVYSGSECRIASDNRTILYTAMPGTSEQVYAVDSAAPGTPVLVGRPYAVNENLAKWVVARNAMRVIIGTVYSGGPTGDYYSVSLDNPTAITTFATNIYDDGSLPGQLDGEGLEFAYAKLPPGAFTGLRRLTLLSTQTSNYNFSLTRADTSTGLLQFQWAP